MSRDYEAALQLAVEAARHAGDLLRREFLKPDGPDCYSPDHAKADEDAERLICKRLLEASPEEWGYLGEETDQNRPARELDGHFHVWTVDPNDGTRWYCAGWRGSATSIGLLCDGKPVLGVVYAFVAPDNEGDLKARVHDLTEPRPGQTVRDNDRLRRVQGCWLGQLTGDALGSMAHFRTGFDLRRYPAPLRRIAASTVSHALAGQPTNNSELAIMLARTLIQNGSYDDECAAQAYGYWLRSRPFDSGGSLIVAVRAMVDAMAGDEPAAHAGRRQASQSSQANDALMRHSPLAIWGHALSPGELDRVVRADTTLTHPNHACQDASALFVVALATTLRESLDSEGAYRVAVDWNLKHGQSAEVHQALADARYSPPDYAHHAGSVLITLQNAFYQALHATTFEEGLVATVMGGGDTNANAAVTGALLGAVHGVEMVPAQWRQLVLSCRLQQGAPGVHQPRPRAFWPVDALILSERLAAIGERHVQWLGGMRQSRRH